MNEEEKLINEQEKLAQIKKELQNNLSKLSKIEGIKKIMLSLRDKVEIDENDQWKLKSTWKITSDTAEIALLNIYNNVVLERLDYSYHYANTKYLRYDEDTVKKIKERINKPKYSLRMLLDKDRPIDKPTYYASQIEKNHKGNKGIVEQNAYVGVNRSCKDDMKTILKALKKAARLTDFQKQDIPNLILIIKKLQCTPLWKEMKEDYLQNNGMIKNQSLVDRINQFFSKNSKDGLSSEVLKMMIKFSALFQKEMAQAGLMTGNLNAKKNVGMRLKRLSNFRISQIRDLIYKESAKIFS